MIAIKGLIMPRKTKGPKGRKVRCLETGRWYTSKAYLSIAKKNRIYCAENREFLLNSLEKAIAASCTPEARKNRSEATKLANIMHPESAERRKKQIKADNWAGTTNTEVITSVLQGLRRAHGKKTAIIDGKEVSFTRNRCVKNNKLSIAYEDCERSKTVGVERRKRING